MPGSIGKEIPYYFRNINHYSDAIYKTGFVIERILEPRPIQAAQKKFKERYNLYSKVPDILIMKLRKPKWELNPFELTSFKHYLLYCLTGDDEVNNYSILGRL